MFILKHFISGILYNLILTHSLFHFKSSVLNRANTMKNFAPDTFCLLGMMCLCGLYHVLLAGEATEILRVQGEILKTKLRRRRRV